MKTKCEFKWFSIPEYDKEAAYLRDMHNHGWKLERIGFPGFYHFIECIPEDVIYQLDYNREGVQHRGEYVQMFADCGWEYLFDFVGFSYFRKPAAEDIDERIFCDDDSRLQMLGRVIKGRLTPMLVIFCAVLLPQFLLLLSDLGNPFRMGVFVVYCVLLVMYLVIFAYVGSNWMALKRKKG